MGISAVVLTRDNQDSIRQTLESIAFCDEILVIDDCSKDQTSTLARQSGATVYTRALNGDFAAQRNFGLTQATGDWVLFVDSDEVVSEALAKEIRDVIGKVDVNGFFLKRQDVMWGKPLLHGETDGVRLLRLAKKGKGEWVRPVHEVWKIVGVVGTLTQPLRHFSHQNVAQFLSDINAYSTINAAYLARLKVRASWWHIFGYPAAKFIQNYIFRKGFLDGIPGMILALMMSFHSFLTRAKLWKLSH